MTHLGVTAVNDRNIGLLDNYDIEVLRTWKGRGALCCEAKQGIFILKEYTGRREKVGFQDMLLERLQEKGFEQAEKIVKTKDQELLVQDQEGSAYILKTYVEGRECDVRDMEECRRAVNVLARLHIASKWEEALPEYVRPQQTLFEFEKHNRELGRVRKFLKERGQKSDFELALFGCYDYFYNQAKQVTEELKKNQIRETEYYICHGDYQYHNIIVANGCMHILNFEKCIYDSPVRDLYLFMRKLLEKSGYAQNIGFELVKAYQEVRPLTQQDCRQLYYRLAYPEKFWKIVNFYYNTGKAWIPGKNMEKLARVARQEEDKQLFLRSFQENYDLS